MEKFKITLVNAPPLAIVEPWYDKPNWGRIALAYLASHLRKDPAFEIQIVDAKLEQLSFDQTVRRVMDFHPDLVGFTAFTNEIKPAAYLAARLKKERDDLCTVIGGVHLTALPKQTLLEFPSFDFGVIGEGEITFLELCQTLLQRKAACDVRGIVYRKNLEIVQTPPRDRVLSLDEIPHPAWDLFPRTPSYWVQTMRGCPFNCLFCMNPNGRVARQRSVENIMEELNLLWDRYQPSEIRFGDELFTVDMVRSEKLMDVLMNSGLGKKIKWDCQTHVRFVNTNLLRKMKEAGCYRVELGIESGDEEKLKMMGKGTNFEMIFSAARAAREAKIPFGTFFIIGQPNETMSSIKKTVDLAVKMNPDLPIIGLMCPYPGTEIARLAAEGKGGYRLETTDWDEYNKQIGGALGFANLTRPQIEWIQIWAYAKVFLWNFRWIDFIKFVWEYRVGAIQVLRKILFKRFKGVSLSKPSDYDTLLNRKFIANREDMVRSRTEWEREQVRELQRSKKAKIHSGVRIIEQAS